MLNSSRGEAETKAFSALDQDEAEAFVCGTMLRVAAVAWFFQLNDGCHIFVKEYQTRLRALAEDGSVVFY